jgi:hypothetical protein
LGVVVVVKKVGRTKDKVRLPPSSAGDNNTPNLET